MAKQLAHSVGSWLSDRPSDAWLDDALPLPDNILEKVSAPPQVDRRAKLTLVPAGVARKPVPESDEKRRKALQQAWDRLTPRQQVFVNSLRHHRFNVSATLRALGKTADRPGRQTVSRWMHDHTAFNFVVKVLKAIARDEVVDPDKLLLRADDIAEMALAPKPILYKGEDTGYREHNLDAALRANEQIMKATGLLREAGKSTRVTVRFVNLAGEEPQSNVIEGEAEVVE